ncbi:PREDICTED: cation channel sperm-associated protein 1 [Mandrillus leucophaeus]|uniref:Cation channel sperm-associated protein 1 n=1 Tax=Mandrillus leucophaeus TaxID=9568 RepID=A0A2K5XSR2_MANLE|nr:PREDICTED: cation channel sperm-associated protein 1 [Mandrillus leucophaeus]
MDQNSVPEKAQNEADTNNTDTFFHSHSSPPHHRPGHSGALHHHGVPQRRGESHHPPEFEDFHDQAFSSHIHQSQHHSESWNHGRAHGPTGFGLAPSQGAVPSHHSYGEDYLNELHRAGRRHHDGSQYSGFHQQNDSHHRKASHHGRRQYLGENLSHYSSGVPHHPSEASHHGGSYLPHGANPYSESFHHSEASYLSGLQHDESQHHQVSHHGWSTHHQSHHHGRSHHHEAHQHRRPSHHGQILSPYSSVGSYQHGISDHHSEYPHSEHSHHTQYHHRTHRHRDHHQHRDHRSAHHSSHLYGDYQYRDYVQSTSQLSIPQTSWSLVHDASGPAASHTGALPPHMAHPRGSAHSMTRSVSAVHSRATQRSKKVHPWDTKDSEDWGKEEGQFRRRKTGRLQRTHKKGHSTNLLQWLWEKLTFLIQGFREMIRKLTQSLAFETFIFVVVCLNTFMLVAQTFAEVEIRGEWYFMALDSIFFCIYVVEALLKIIVLGLSYFYDFWNNLDFFIMAMAVLDFLLMQTHSFAIYHQSLFRILKVFKSLRALRAIRVLRRLRFLTSVQEVTGTLGQSLPSIAAILILMFTCLFLFSAVLRALFRKSDPKRFQNILTTIFTLFTLLTLDDWSLIYIDSRAQGAWYIIPILIIYIIIQYFIFLNLVITVLVDSFQMALFKGLEKMKQERAARIQEKLLEDSLTELRAAEPKEVASEGTMLKQLIEKKFGTMTEKQQQLLFHYLQLVASVEQQQQKFRSQAAVIDEIVDTTFEAGEEDFRQ